MAKQPESVEIVETTEGRFVVTTFADGVVVRTKVERGGTARRKPRKPIARATVGKREGAGET